MKLLGAWGSVAALFVLGVLLGGLAVHIHHGSQMPPPPRHDGPEHRGPDHEGRGKAPRGPHGRSGGSGFIDAMHEKLGLTAEQQEQVRTISEESRKQLETLRGEWRPQIERHMTETRERIDAVLTPEQRTVWAEMHRGERRRVERFLMGEGRGGRRGPREPRSN